jgi:tetratricopeptide (TPR) repeat protein
LPEPTTAVVQHEKKLDEKISTDNLFEPTEEILGKISQQVPLAAAAPLAATNTLTLEAQSAKDAVKQLLNRSRQAGKKAHKRLFIIYGLLTFTSIMLLAFYYVLLSSNSSINTPPLAYQNSATANIAAATAIAEALPTQAEKEPLPQSDPATENSAPDLEPLAVDNPKNNVSTQVDAHPKQSLNAPELTTKPSRKTTTAGSAATKNTTAKSVSLPPEQTAKPAIITRQITEYEISAAIQRGYQAYQRGDYASADAAYKAALIEAPYERDALLGAAATAVQLNRNEEALRLYQQRLARAPKDEYAQAGILALTSSSKNNPQFDSELNNLLHEFPNASHLHFLRGSLYAQQQQWSAAQIAFFEAWQRDKKNPDYAFNLAVALDHLQQPKEAINFYQRALQLSIGRQVRFSADTITQRIATLEQKKP